MRYLKIGFNLLIPIILGFLIFKSWDSIIETWTYIRGGDINGQIVSGLTLWSILILGLQIPIQLLSYGALSHFYYSYFVNVGLLARCRLRDLYRTSLELNFVNSVFPSGGVSGFSYLGLRLRPLGIKVASATLAQSLRFALTFITYLPILAVGLLFLAFDNRANNLVVLIGAGLFLVMVLVILIGWYLISDSNRIKKLVYWLPAAVRWLTQRLPFLRQQRLLEAIDKVERVLGEIHNDYSHLKRNPRQLLAPAGYALAVNIFELLTIYAVYLAFYQTLGEIVNPGAVIIAYLVANFAGLVVILPGGIGLYEILMIQIVIWGGGSSDIAIVSTLVYRVINLVVFVPLGYCFYQMAVRNKLAVQPRRPPKSSS